MTAWPPHVWHDCEIHGHVGSDPDRCHACVGGLGGCVVCGQWEGEIVDGDRCLGREVDSVEGMEKALQYHHEVASVIRPATDDDLYPGKVVAVFDAGTWQYAGTVVVRGKQGWEIRFPYDGGSLEDVPLKWEYGVPAIGVYDPYNAQRSP
jgi:hypothetical protein